MWRGNADPAGLAGRHMDRLMARGMGEEEAFELTRRTWENVTNGGNESVDGGERLFERRLADEWERFLREEVNA